MENDSWKISEDWLHSLRNMCMKARKIRDCLHALKIESAISDDCTSRNFRLWSVASWMDFLLPTPWILIWRCKLHTWGMCQWKVGWQVEGNKEDSNALSFRISDAVLSKVCLTLLQHTLLLRNHIPEGMSSLSPADISPIDEKSY